MTSVLRFGAQGDDVKTLQQALKDMGFSPGALDSDFGAATKQVVLAFQRSHVLLADGVAGPRTQMALGLVVDDSLIHLSL